MDTHSPTPSTIPTALWDGSPDTPLASFPAFCAAIAGRLAAGAKEYGDVSFTRPVGDLLEEIEQELFDVAGWAFVLWVRVRALRAEADPSVRDPQP